jgi:hypothetical protein
MKLIQVILFDPKDDAILSVGHDLELPGKEVDEQQNSFDVAHDIVEALGYDCTAMLWLYHKDNVEIWQALDVAEKLNHDEILGVSEWIDRHFIDSGYIDCKTDGSWRNKLIRRTLFV